MTSHLASTIRSGFYALLALVNAACAQSIPIRYEIFFKDQLVATQNVTLAEANGVFSFSSFFEADLPVFVARHVYSESISASWRKDGTLLQFQSVRIDGPNRFEASGAFSDETGILEVFRTDSYGTTISQWSRKDYDFHSLAIYGTPPDGFLPAHNPAKVFDVARGTVVPIDIHAVDQSETTQERQHVASKMLAWTQGPFVSRSWHPERHSNLPTRYLRHTENGQFTFVLQR